MFADETFDFILCRAAFKNFSEPLLAVKEMYRVLKKRGRAVIIDLRRDASQKSIDEEVEKMGLTWMSALFTKLAFRFMLLKRAYTQSEFEKFAAETAFHHADIKHNNIGFEITLQKQ